MFASAEKPSSGLLLSLVDTLLLILSYSLLIFEFCVSFMVQFLSVFVQELVCFFCVMKFVGREFVIISSFSCSFLTGEFSGLSFQAVVLFV